ncbi:UNVERIFIED_CONTAM: hypothetical protein FKN15_051388 [Acipenser sinensis]
MEEQTALDLHTCWSFTTYTLILALPTLVWSSDPATESPALESTVPVSINLVDVNDNPPMLTYPETHFCYPVRDSKAVLMKAVDKDLDPHGAPFKFSLEEGDKTDMRDWEIVPVNDDCYIGATIIQ